MTNPTERAALRALLEAKTPGPWKMADAELIAALRNAVPALLDEVERLERERDTLARELWGATQEHVRERDALRAELEVEQLRLRIVEAIARGGEMDAAPLPECESGALDAVRWINTERDALRKALGAIVAEYPEGGWHVRPHALRASIDAARPLVIASAWADSLVNADEAPVKP